MKTSTSPPAAAPRSAPRVALVSARAAATRLSRALKDEGLPVVAGVGAVKELEPRVATSADAVVVHVPDARDDPATRVRALRRLAPTARIVVVTPSLNVRQLRVLVDAGVDALVLEGDAAESLGAAVRSVCSGLLAFPASLRQTLVAPVLSTREKQVLGLVVLGLTNAEIARKLHLAESTVKSHLSSSFTKLGARSRNEATALILDPATGLGTGILTISDGR